MKKKSALETKYDKIESEFKEQRTIYMADLENIFEDMNKSTLYWNISKLVERGYLIRVRNGIYSLNERKNKPSIMLSGEATRLQEILDETGFEYYISGMDILQRYMQHVPQQYPQMLFVEKIAKDEIIETIESVGIETYMGATLSEGYERHIMTGSTSPMVVLYTTENFKDSINSIATVERAFVDLYYAVTRNHYPLALQELVRVYENLDRLGIMDKKKLISVAAKRGIQYDIRYIVESKYITDSAAKFVEYMQKED